MKTPLPVTLARRWKAPIAVVLTERSTTNLYGNLLKMKYGAVVEITSKVTFQNYVHDVGVFDAHIYCDSVTIKWCDPEYWKKIMGGY